VLGLEYSSSNHKEADGKHSQENKQLLCRVVVWPRRTVRFASSTAEFRPHESGVKQPLSWEVL
jgi:hypothetical protein